jgi:hypothetical protein
MITARARIVNYDSRIVIYSFIVLIVNDDRTVITIVNYDRKTFIVQATACVFEDGKIKLSWKIASTNLIKLFNFLYVWV